MMRSGRHAALARDRRHRELGFRAQVVINVWLLALELLAMVVFRGCA
jgi:hypothetical protein